MTALMAKYLVDSLDWSASAFGLVMGCGSAGGILGGLCARALVARFVPARVMLTALLAILVGHLPLLCAGQGLAGQVAVALGCALQRRGGRRRHHPAHYPAAAVRPALQGRQQAVGTWLAHGPRSVAALAAGGLASAVGIHPIGFVDV